MAKDRSILSKTGVGRLVTWEQLRGESAKLRALAHLIEHEHLVGEEADHDVIRWGLGLMLSEASLRIKQIAAEIERIEMDRARL